MHRKRHSYFPPRQVWTDPDGIVAVGGDLSTEILLDAYSRGIFPWPHEGMPMLWFSPLERGIIRISDRRAPKSFRKFLRNTAFELRKNTAFAQVLEGCKSQARPGQEGTWITDEIETAYLELHNLKIAYSYEAWLKNELVGGLYGVRIGGVYGAESMFYKVSNASKFCLWHLLEDLALMKKSFLDVQMVTPVSESFGARYVSREEYYRLFDRTFKTL